MKKSMFVLKDGRHKRMFMDNKVTVENKTLMIWKGEGRVLELCL